MHVYLYCRSYFVIKGQTGLGGGGGGGGFGSVMVTI
jgi:hypothetical protein